jgi:peptidyl-prolyl cis-trans isomerase C
MRTLLALSALLYLGALGCTPESKKKDPAEGAADGPKADAPATAEEKHGLTKEEAAMVLAKVGETEITLGQFADRLGSQSPYLRARYNSPERRQEFLDNMVRFELLALEAKKRGHDARPEVQRVQRQMMVQQMMKEMFDDEGVKLSDISDKEIAAYYEKNRAEFNKPAQRRASHILLKDKASAEKVLAELKSKEGDMATFRKLAKEKNLDENTKARFGDLRFFAQVAQEGDGGPPKAIRDAAFALEKTGDVHPEVIQTEQGFHVLKLTGQRAALERSLEDARRLIQNRLWRERREAAIDKFVGELRAKANIKENLSALDQVKIDLSAPGPEEQQKGDLGTVEGKGAGDASGEATPAEAPK